MANRLKVGLLKEAGQILEGREVIVTLIVDEEAQWFCSEIIDGQLQEKLIKGGIFETGSHHYVVVDGELAQTSGVQLIDELLPTNWNPSSTITLLPYALIAPTMPLQDA